MTGTAGARRGSPSPGSTLDADAAFVRGRLEQGSMGGVGPAVDDCRKTYEELSAKGGASLQEPAERRDFTAADFA